MQGRFGGAADSTERPHAHTMSALSATNQQLSAQARARAARGQQLQRVERNIQRRVSSWLEQRLRDTPIDAGADTPTEAQAADASEVVLPSTSEGENCEVENAEGNFKMLSGELVEVVNDCNTLKRTVEELQGKINLARSRIKQQVQARVVLEEQRTALMLKRKLITGKGSDELSSSSSSSSSDEESPPTSRKEAPSSKRSAAKRTPVLSKEVEQDEQEVSEEDDNDDGYDDIYDKQAESGQEEQQGLGLSTRQRWAWSSMDSTYEDEEQRRWFVDAMERLKQQYHRDKEALTARTTVLQQQVTPPCTEFLGVYFTRTG
eukprot:TRINITY_DN365_c1_g1_i2.p1 TRINITY_DN365_c1_g1~~TRINITY_DN365_c1_g1_i2.p1  ORF type:complete len:327 (-),score=101.32 TRINITY_DN365_c1_g1_i2:132-1088(-)